jgi:hypothetical protein
MIIVLKSTDRIIDINGIESRLWEGKTESGIPVHCLIVRIAVNKEADQSEFEKELLYCDPPSPASNAAFPAARLVV